MRELFSILVALLATTTLWAYDFQSGNLYYDITSDFEPYSVEVAPQSYPGYNDSIENYLGLTTAIIPESVTHNGRTYNVTSIGYASFYKCTSLTSVIIPNSVKKIEGLAFARCESLSSITIPNSVTSIGNGAFSCCSSLVYITIPDSITSIEYGTFDYCPSLVSVTIGKNVTSIGDNVFYSCPS